MHIALTFPKNPFLGLSFSPGVSFFSGSYFSNLPLTNKETGTVLSTILLLESSTSCFSICIKPLPFSLLINNSNFPDFDLLGGIPIKSILSENFN